MKYITFVFLFLFATHTLSSQDITGIEYEPLPPCWLLIDEASYHWSNVSPFMEKTLTGMKSRNRAKMHCGAFGPIGSGVISYHSGIINAGASYNVSRENLEHNLVEYLHRVDNADYYISYIDISIPNQWIVIYNQSHAGWQNIPQDLIEAIQNARAAQQKLLSVSFTPLNDGWVMVTDQKVYGQNIPQDLANQIQLRQDDGSIIRQIAFTPTGGWFILSNINEVDANGLPEDLMNQIDATQNMGMRIEQIAIGLP